MRGGGDLGSGGAKLQVYGGGIERQYMRRTASMRAYTRIGVAGLALVLLRVLISFWTLDTRQQIKNVNVGSEYVNGLLRWAAGDDGVQMVVFGDSWVDNSEVKGVEGGGESWVESLCEMVWLCSCLSCQSWEE